VEIVTSAPSFICLGSCCRNPHSDRSTSRCATIDAWEVLPPWSVWIPAAFLSIGSQSGSVSFQFTNISPTLSLLIFLWWIIALQYLRWFVSQAYSLTELIFPFSLIWYSLIGSCFHFGCLTVSGARWGLNDLNYFISFLHLFAHSMSIVHLVMRFNQDSPFAILNWTCHHWSIYFCLFSSDYPDWW